MGAKDRQRGFRAETREVTAVGSHWRGGGGGNREGATGDRQRGLQGATKAGSGGREGREWHRWTPRSVWEATRKQQGARGGQLASSQTKISRRSYRGRTRRGPRGDNAAQQTEGVTGSHQNWRRGEAEEGAAQKGTTGRQEERLKGPRAQAVGGSLALRPQTSNQITAPRRSARARKGDSYNREDRQRGLQGATRTGGGGKQGKQRHSYNREKPGSFQGIYDI